MHRDRSRTIRAISLLAGPALLFVVALVSLIVVNMAFDTQIGASSNTTYIHPVARIISDICFWTMGISALVFIPCLIVGVVLLSNKKDTPSS